MTADVGFPSKPPSHEEGAHACVPTSISQRDGCVPRLMRCSRLAVIWPRRSSRSLGVGAQLLLQTALEGS
jgi:hypothetical protein